MNKGSQNKLSTFEFIQRKQIPFFLLRNIIKTKPRSLKRQHSHTQSSLSLSLLLFVLLSRFLFRPPNFFPSFYESNL